jgi:lysozyme
MDTPTKLSDGSLEILKALEGYSGLAYLCQAGVATLGHGTTRGIKLGMTCTPAQAEEMLRRDVEEFENVVLKHARVPLTQRQFDALVLFVYNIGEPQFLASTALKRLNDRDYKGVPEAMSWFNKISRKIGGKRVTTVSLGLSKRRAIEGRLFSAA